MRKQIAAANWKMNLTYQQGEKLLDEILRSRYPLENHQHVVFAVPYPYLLMTRSEVENEKNYHAAAQNCYNKKAGAFTGEISAEMLHSIGVPYCVIGHSERREYFNESNATLAEKVNLCLENHITPIFCCGEPLSARSRNTKHLCYDSAPGVTFSSYRQRIKDIIVAYEPIWAIGTGKTASTEQAQEMHAHLRSVIGRQYGRIQRRYLFYMAEV